MRPMSAANTPDHPEQLQKSGVRLAHLLDSALGKLTPAIQRAPVSVAGAILYLSMRAKDSATFDLRYSCWMMTRVL